MSAMADGGEGDEKALRFYTACFDGNLDEVQRIVQGNPDLELNRVIHGGTAFAAAEDLDRAPPATETRSAVSKRLANRSTTARERCNTNGSECRRGDLNPHALAGTSSLT